MLIWLGARYLFFFNFCTTWHFPFLQKHENNKKQKQTLNSCFRCISLPHRNTIYKTCNSSAIIQLCDNIILHTMNLILSVSVCIFFIIFFYLRTENVLNNVLMIANNKEHNFYFIYFLLLQYNMRKCFILSWFCAQVFHCRLFFMKCVSTENNEAKPTISDKCSVCFVSVI